MDYLARMLHTLFMDKKTMQEFEDFVARFGDQSNVIRIGSKLSHLTGFGTEYLIQEGEIVAKFQDGDLIRAIKPIDSSEDTVTAA